MLNPDTEISSGALRTLTNYADIHPKVGMIAPHVINPDGLYNTQHFASQIWPKLFLGFLKS
ncbi:MAG: hypothetical protein CM1200mP6_09540 [Anaerolineaceae bacterium]|nr:MAG: hypothetical protein CM1200mP6_09540 [Anaerolineaceae bacterium]